MGRKHKTLALLALLLLLGMSAGACSTNVEHARERAESTEEADPEEVLSSDEDEFGRTDFSTPDGKASGFFVSVGYLAMIVGSTILPLLLL